MSSNTSKCQDKQIDVMLGVFVVMFLCVALATGLNMMKKSVGLDLNINPSSAPMLAVAHICKQNKTRIKTANDGVVVCEI